MALADLLDRIEGLLGPPEPLPTTDPFELVVWENMAYLADDAHRAAAFSALRRRVGLTPGAILDASRDTLVEVTRLGGIHPELRAGRLQDIAAMVESDYGGDLATELSRDPTRAVKALRRFPSIGKPGAEKILLFSGRMAVLALESNGLRVLNRLGYGSEQRDYAASYRSAQEAAGPEIPADVPTLLRAHQLLRSHGQRICRRVVPRCDACPLTGACQYYRNMSSKSGEFSS